jgi:tetratricopeptide (TPR) repeat protein
MEPTNASMSFIARAITKWWFKRRANVAELLKRDEQAVDAYRAILRIDPADEYARSVLGNLYARIGDRPAAIGEFQELVARHPQHADGWFNLGFIHDQRDELPDAERCFRKALELQPALDRAWYGLGLVLIRQGRLEEAVAALKRNTKLQPFSPYGYYQLGMTYHHLGRKVDAWKMYEQLTQFEPKYAATLKRDLEQTVPQAVSIRNDSQPTEDNSAEALQLNKN